MLDYVERTINPGTKGVNNLLGFSLTNYEAVFLQTRYPQVVRVSLFGKFGGIDGVDARDLSRFQCDSFAGVYSCLLFDYFSEHELALTEAFRILRPGGVFMTHIGNVNATAVGDEPTVLSIISPREGYYEYIPPGESMLRVTVGVNWFIDAMRRVGFSSVLYRPVESTTGIETLWFLGVKPLQPAAIVNSTYHRSFENAIPLPDKFLDSSILVRVTMPIVNQEFDDLRFADHMETTVLACRKGGYLLSRDNGSTWESFILHGREEWPFANGKILRSGDLILQARCLGAMEKSGNRAELLVVRNGIVLSEFCPPGNGEWHGTSSIDEAHGTLMYADYQDNGPGRPMRVSRVFRSRDGGSSWEVVMEMDAVEIRHFHLARACPYTEGQWWLSSGDEANECRIWRSTDDGDSWSEVSIDAKLAERFGRKVLRFTDVLFDENRIIWGTDDLLGSASMMDQRLSQEQRSGSRLIAAFPGESGLKLEEIGYCGQPVRSMVDLGKYFIIMTQSARLKHSARPQIFLMEKASGKLEELFKISRYDCGVTGFTYSRASRLGVDGRFFTYRGPRDVFNGGNYLLMWEWELMP